MTVPVAPLFLRLQGRIWWNSKVELSRLGRMPARSQQPLGQAIQEGRHGTPSQPVVAPKTANDNQNRGKSSDPNNYGNNHGDPNAGKRDYWFYENANLVPKPS